MQFWQPPFSPPSFSRLRQSPPATPLAQLGMRLGPRTKSLQAVPRVWLRAEKRAHPMLFCMQRRRYQQPLLALHSHLLRMTGPEISDGCLVFHNGIDDKASQASIKAVLQVTVSPDLTAFRFTVREWQFQRFLKPITTSWFQTSGIKDFVLKIEFLSPGSEGLGTRRVFVEHPFVAVDRETIANAFTPDQQLPWFSSPPRSSPDATDLNLPLNLKITLVETTKPNQFAAWMQEIAKDKKTDVAALVKDAVKRAVLKRTGLNSGRTTAKSSIVCFANSIRSTMNSTRSALRVVRKRRIPTDESGD